ncbi:MAG: hypothetical protein EA373_04520 [Oceanospirillales bacterium]|nr:MAG: hypothetical protein EA373_04520 [Oceanospirillales bacterium]
MKSLVIYSFTVLIKKLCVILTLLLCGFAAWANTTTVNSECDPVLAVEYQGVVLLWHEHEGSVEIAKGSCAALDKHAHRIAYCTPSRDTLHPGRELRVQSIDSIDREWVYRPDEGTFISEVVWSPDGSQLAFIETDAEFRSHLIIWNPENNPSHLISASMSSTGSMGLWWSLSWTADSSALTVHDMTELYQIALDGRVESITPLTELIDSGLETITSTDRILPSPHDPSVFAYTRLVQGSTLFSSIMHEPNSALFLHDQLLGRAKNIRLTDESITVLDMTWTPDGKSLYFTGFEDTQAAENYPFRIYRIDLQNLELTELLKGERVSAACRDDTMREFFK